MHELPITQRVCDLAVSEAERAGAAKVCRIFLKIGEYTDFVPDIIELYFELVSEGTVAEGAELSFETVPAVLWCPECQAERRGEKLRLRCPVCGSRRVELRSGREFYIDRMEIED